MSKKKESEILSGRIPRMRTLDAAYALVRKVDPGTSLTKHALRALALAGRVPSFVVGNKRLINVDALLDRMASDPESLSLKKTEPTLATPKLPIRRVAENA